MISVREFTNGADILAHAAEVRRKFYPSRQSVQAQVQIPAEHAANDVPVKTQEPPKGSRRRPEKVALSDALLFSSEVLALRAMVRDLRNEVAHLREEVGMFSELGREQKSVSGLRVLALVMSEFGISRNDLISERRHRSFTKPRHALMWLLREYTVASLPAIGRFVGHRDHTTVLNGCANCVKMMATDSEYRAKIEAIQAAINSEAA